MSGLSRQCQRYRERLPEYAEGRLSGPPRAEIEQHLAGCARCAQEVADLRVMLAAVRDIPPEAPPEQLTASVLRAVARHAAAQPRRATRPFWSRVAIPASAAVGLLAVVLGYQLMEQGYTPKSMSGALSAQRRSADSPRVASSPAPATTPAQEADQTVEMSAAREESAQKAAPTKSSAREGKAADRKQAAPKTASAEPARTGTALRPGVPEESAGGAQADRTAPACVPLTPAAPAAERVAAKREKQERERTRTDLDERRKEGAPKPMPPAGRSGGGGGRGAYQGPGPNRSRAQVERGAVPAPLGAVAEMQMARPATARAVLTRQGDQLALAVQLAAGPGEKVEVKTGEQSLWSGAPVGDERVVLSLEGEDGGPKRIPITVSSPTGTRNYTLFAPPFAQLGQQSGTMVRRYRGTPLATVFAEMSAKGGLVLLVEGPLEREMNGELNLEFPKAAVETLAKYGGYEVRTDDLLVYTLEAK